MFAHLLFYWSSSNRLPHTAVQRRLSIFIAHRTSFPARLLPCENCSICPVVPFRGNIFAWNSLVCLDVGFFFCRFSSMRFKLPWPETSLLLLLFFFGALRLLPIKCLRLALLLASHSRLHVPIFLQLSAPLGYRTNKAWGLLRGCHVMPRQRLPIPDGSSCVPFSHFPPFLVRSITRCDCASEAVSS